MIDNKLQQALSYEDIYLKYYPKLVRFSIEYVLSRPDAENIVQDCFLALWEQKDTLSSIQNVNAFLFRLVRNKCVDFLRNKILTENKKQTIQETFLKEYTFKLQSIETFDDALLSEENLEKIIRDAIDLLPSKCKEIFILSKIEGMKYEEIASQMKISPNTVRNQISIALKKMRDELKDYYPILLFLFGS